MQRAKGAGVSGIDACANKAESRSCVRQTGTNNTF